MIDVSSEVKLVKNGLLNVEGVEYLFDLYLPLLGEDATFLYLFLANKVKKEDRNLNLGDLVNESQLNLQKFLLAKKSLESIGLISTFKKNDEEKYILVIYDACTPKKFFENLTFKGLYVQSVGEEKANKILKKYEIKKDFKGYNDVSAKINDSFVINFNPNYLDLDKGMELTGFNKNTLQYDFSEVKLNKYLKEKTQIRVDAISEEEFDLIVKIATLYGLKENDIGGLINECFIPEEAIGHKINFEKLKRLARTYVRTYKVSQNKTDKFTYINSDSDAANLIRSYENTSPIKFLMSKQKGVEVSDADKSIIEELAGNYGFSNGIINALLDYVLKNKDGELSRNYILKIAATLVRKGCQNTLDCLKLLNKKPTTKVIKTKETPKEKPQQKSNIISLEDYEDVDIDID